MVINDADVKRSNSRGTGVISSQTTAGWVVCFVSPPVVPSCVPRLACIVIGPVIRPFDRRDACGEWETARV